MKNLINQQKSSDSTWTDEAGNAIPYNRTTTFERSVERNLAQIAKKAVSIHANLTDFKDELQQKAEELYEQFIKENGGKAPGKGKGGATFYNFDRSIKVEVAISEPPTFDENTIELAKAKLNEVLEDGLNGAKDYVKPLVMDAFQTSNGNLDHKRVLGLRRYAERINDARYTEAMSLIDKSIRRPRSKEYYRVWLKDSTGEYQNVQLNFSAV